MAPPPAFDTMSTAVEEPVPGARSSDGSLFLITDFAYLAVLLDWAQNFSIMASSYPFALSFILLLLRFNPSILILSLANLF